MPEPLPRLSLATLGRLASEHRGQVDPRALSIGVVHLGVGAFHRAHQAAYIERAIERSGEARWGICAVSERSSAAAAVLAAQDGLYSLRLASPSSTSLRVLSVLREALFAREQHEELRARLSDPAVSLVTLTVTEKGYRHDPATKRLLRSDEDLIADAAGRPPVSVIGQLVRGFEARRRADAGPLTVLSCDNLPANGALLSDLVGEFLELPGTFDVGLAEWVAANVAFPCTMVDRIVPATSPADLAAAARALGLVDEAAVVAEPFTQWVIEDCFLGPRPRLEEAGALLVDQVAPYEMLKLRVLNASHSALAYLGALAGFELIAEAVADPVFAAFVSNMVRDEVAPSLDPPPGVAVDAYRDEVLERFANPLLAHRCLQVASDGSQKLPQRVLGTIANRLAAGAAPRRLALVVAAYLRALREQHNEMGQAIAIADPLADVVRLAVSAADSPETIAERALSIEAIFGEDLGGDARLRALLAEALEALERAPVREVVAAYAGGGGS